MADEDSPKAYIHILVPKDMKIVGVKFPAGYRKVGKAWARQLLEAGCKKVTEQEYENARPAPVPEEDSRTPRKAGKVVKRKAGDPDPWLSGNLRVDADDAADDDVDLADIPARVPRRMRDIETGDAPAPRKAKGKGPQRRFEGPRTELRSSKRRATTSGPLKGAMEVEGPSGSAGSAPKAEGTAGKAGRGDTDDAGAGQGQA